MSKVEAPRTASPTCFVAPLLSTFLFSVFFRLTHLVDYLSLGLFISSLKNISKNDSFLFPHLDHKIANFFIQRASEESKIKARGKQLNYINSKSGWNQLSITQNQPNHDLLFTPWIEAFSTELWWIFKISRSTSSHLLWTMFTRQWVKTAVGSSK
jgi:hypothetical protein